MTTSTVEVLIRVLVEAHPAFCVKMCEEAVSEAKKFAGTEVIEIKDGGMTALIRCTPETRVKLAAKFPDIHFGPNFKTPKASAPKFN